MTCERSRLFVFWLFCLFLSHSVSKVTLDSMEVNQELFNVYALTTGLLILKMLVMAGLTARQRYKHGVCDFEFAFRGRSIIVLYRSSPILRTLSIQRIRKYLSTIRMLRGLGELTWTISKTFRLLSSLELFICWLSNRLFLWQNSFSTA